MAVCAVYLVLLVTVVGSVQGQGDGLFFNNTMINHGIVTLANVGISVSDVVQCRTTVADCCTNSDTHTGDWFIPGGAMASTITSHDIHQVKGPGYVYLQRNRGGTEGIYRCEIGPAGSKDTYYIGLYSSGNGTPVISSPILFSLLTAVNAATPMFTLTCISAGGPATSVTWTLDGSPQSGGTSQITNELTATYTNTLTVTGRTAGDYQCSVSNARTSTTQTITVIAADPPIRLHAIVTGKNNVSLSWAAPTSQAIIGYVVFYYLLGNTFENIINKSSETRVTIGGLQYGGQYSIAMLALSTHLPSPVTKPITIIVAAPDVAPEVMVLRVNSTHMNVSWAPLHPDDARGEVISYTVQYTPTDGSSESMTVSVTGELYIVIGGLDPQLTYQVEVWANTAAGSGKASDPEEVPLPASTNTIIGAVAAVVAVVVVIIIAIIIIVVVARVIHSHKQAVFSQGTRDEVAVSGDPKAIAVSGCPAYGAFHRSQPTTEDDHEYEVLPMRPLPPHLPTSSSS